MQNTQAIVALLGKDISRIQPDSVNVIEEPIIHALFLRCHRQEGYQSRYTRIVLLILQRAWDDMVNATRGRLAITIPKQEQP